MAYVVIAIPGGSTRYDDAPQVRILGASGESLSIVITYRATAIRPDQPPILGEITFLDVLEYRWIADVVDYEEHPQHHNDFEFGLIQITDSEYIKNMAAKGPWSHYPGQGFGPTIPESHVKHFRLAFDEYGRFDIIALGISIREIVE